MPGMTGLELARKVKELNPDIQIILMSSFEINTDEFEILRQNGKVDAFADKPIPLSKLNELIKNNF